MNWLTKLSSLIAFSFLVTSALGDAAEGLTQSGNEKFGKGDFVGALADYSKVVQLKPNNAIVYYNRGLARDATKDFAGAIADYSKAIQLEPEFAFAYNNRGKTKQVKGDLDGALA